MIVDGQEHEESLFKMVMSTQETSNQNNIIKFSDNSRYIFTGIKQITFDSVAVSKYS